MKKWKITATFPNTTWRDSNNTTPFVGSIILEAAGFPDTSTCPPQVLKTAKFDLIQWARECPKYVDDIVSVSPKDATFKAEQVE